MEGIVVYVTNINLLKLRTYFMYRQFLHSEIICSTHTVPLRVLRGSQKKQR
jgi:hypothetical protein